MARYYYDRVAFDTATTGTGNVTAGSAINDSFLDPSETDIGNGDNPILLIQEGLDFEICQATYVSAGPHFTRDTVIVSKIGGTVGTSKMDLAGAAVVRFVTPALLWDEVLSAILDHTGDTSAAHAASAISFSANGDVAATDVQGAIDELDDEKQPLDSDLTAIAGLSSNGLIARTGSGTAAVRSVAGTTNQISVANGDGVAANPTLSLPSPTSVPGGLGFNGETAAANLLDDYEEGTFSPTLTTNGTNFTSVTYDGSTEGHYTKIGNVVTIRLNLLTDAVTVGSASGSVQISGLPFAPNGFPCAVAVGEVDDWAGEEPIAASVLSSTAVIGLQYRAAVDGNTVAVAVADVGTTANDNGIQIAGMYYTNS